MAQTKLTKKDKIKMLLGLNEVQENPELVSFLENEYALLEKKASSKSNKTNVENEKVAEILVAELAKMEKPVTISELMNGSEVIKNYVLENGKTLTNQKITSIFKTLVENKTIVHETKGKNSLYMVA